jgi:hypothetical protein
MENKKIILIAEGIIMGLIQILIGYFTGKNGLPFTQTSKCYAVAGLDLVAAIGYIVLLIKGSSYRNAEEAAMDDLGQTILIVLLPMLNIGTAGLIWTMYTRM